MYMFVVQLITVYGVCSYITCQGQGVFLTRVVPSSLVCGSLCTYTTRCGSFIWDAATRSCHLHTGGDTETEMMPVQKSGKGSQTMTCHTRPCEEKEVCVPAEARVKYLCLASGVPTSTTAAPMTTTTTTTTTTDTLTSTTITKTSRTTPITTTTTLSTTTTVTPITTTTTLSTTTTMTPITTSTTLSTTTTMTPITTSTTLSTTITTTPITATTTTLSTTTTATPITRTTTTTATLTSATITKTSRTTPITTTTTTLSTTTTTTPIATTITTTLSTTSTTTPTTPTTNLPTTPPTTTTTTPCPEESHKYVGCYKDRWSRLLPNGHLVRNTDLTIETCKLYCHRINYTHFGVENGRECFCGDVIKGGYAKGPDTECNVPCTGDKSTACGGGWRISIYKIG